MSARQGQKLLRDAVQDLLVGALDGRAPRVGLFASWIDVHSRDPRV